MRFDGYNVSVVQCALYENGTLKIGMHLCPREKTARKAVFPENSVFCFNVVVYFYGSRF